MKLETKIVGMLAVAAIILWGQQYFGMGQESDINTQQRTNFDQAVREYPRGGLGIPAQWFMMESMVGWERMMFIFGYADNRETCLNMVEMARKESPERNFRCEDAN